MGHAHQAKTAVCMQVHWGRDTHWIAPAPSLQKQVRFLLGRLIQSCSFKSGV